MYISDLITSKDAFKPGYLLGTARAEYPPVKINNVGDPTQKSVGIIWAVYI